MQLMKVVPPIAGLAEAAEILGWKKPQIAQYMERAERNGWPDGMFPRPVQRLASGPIWLRSQIETYKMR